MRSGQEAQQGRPIREGFACSLPDIQTGVAHYGRRVGRMFGRARGRARGSQLKDDRHKSCSGRMSDRELTVVRTTVVVRIGGLFQGCPEAQTVWTTGSIVKGHPGLAMVAEYQGQQCSQDQGRPFAGRTACVKNVARTGDVTLARSGNTDRARLARRSG
jgi:hypothetical protein